MRLQSLIVAAGLVLVGGCATPLEVGSITEIQPRTAAKGVDVHEPRRVAGTPGVPDFAGDQLLEVRTFVFKDGVGQEEVPGAACTLSAADFNATMTSPAKVRVPLYRGQSSQLAVSCELPGYQRKMITVAALDVTRSQRLASGANGGLVGVLAVNAIDAMSDNTKNEWRYPVARVVLEPLPQKTASGAPAQPAAR